MVRPPLVVGAPGGQPAFLPVGAQPAVHDAAQEVREEQTQQGVVGA